MKKQIAIIIMFLVLIVTGVVVILKRESFGLFASSRDNNGPGITLTIGGITDQPIKNAQEYQVLADYLQPRLKSIGVKEVKVLMTRSPLEMSILLKQKKEDLFIDNPFTSYVISNKTNADVILIRAKNGTEVAHSIVVVGKNSAVRSLDQLKGKVIAFKSSDSATGHFLPHADLLVKGYKLKLLEAPTDNIPADTIGYYFANEEEEVLKDVYKGKAAAGAMEDKDFSDAGAEYPDQFRIIYTTPGIVKNTVTVRGDLDRTIQEKIKEVLIGMKDSSEGKKIMAEFKDSEFKDIKTQPDLDERMKAYAKLLETDIMSD